MCVHGMNIAMYIGRALLKFQLGEISASGTGWQDSRLCNSAFQDREYGRNFYCVIRSGTHESIEFEVPVKKSRGAFFYESLILVKRR